MILLGRAAIAVISISAALLLSACSEEKKPIGPPCLPNPTLQCVVDKAAKSIEALADTRIVSFSFDDLMTVAAAQKKLGDTAGLAKTVEIGRRQLSTPLLTKTRSIEFTGRFVNEKYGQTLAREFIAKYPDFWRDDIAKGATIFSPLEPLEPLLYLGLKDDARDLLAQERAIVDPHLDTMTGAQRMSYFMELLKANRLLGDHDAAMAAADQVLAINSGDVNVATELLNAGLPELAHKALVNGYLLVEKPGLAEPPDLPSFQAAEVYFRLAHMTGDKPGEAAAVDTMRRFREELTKNNNPIEGAKVLSSNFFAIFNAGVRETALGMRAEVDSLATVLQTDKYKEDLPGYLFVEIYSAMGDEPAAIAMLDYGMLVKGEVPDIAKAHVCQHLGRYGQTEAALRCVTRLDGKNPLRELLALAGIIEGMQPEAQ